MKHNIKLLYGLRAICNQLLCKRTKRTFLTSILYRNVDPHVVYHEHKPFFCHKGAKWWNQLSQLDFSESDFISTHLLYSS